MTNARYLFRGQTPTYDNQPAGQATADAQTFVQQPQAVVPYAAPAPNYQPFTQGIDPFLGAPPPELFFYDPFSRYFQNGVMGPQPYPIGLQSSFDVAWLPSQDTVGAGGAFRSLEVNAQMQSAVLLPSGVIFGWAPDVSYRSWSGPSGPDLPASVYRIGSEFWLGGQDPMGLGFKLFFKPSVASDFQRQLNSDGYNWDGGGYLTWKVDPTLMLVGGAAFWDRATDRIIPYAGLVWTPDPNWEFRLLFPKSRISVRLGDWQGGTVWFYGSAEYNSEAYQVTLDSLNRKDRVELTDYRILMGLANDGGVVNSFIEGGWILDRQVNFKGKTADFDIEDGWLVRGGIRF